MPTPSSGSLRVFYPRLNREELVAELRRQLPALEAVLPLTRVVLFGSWAGGRATAFSDVDLLVVYAGAAREDANRLIRGTLKLRGLEPHVYTDEEATALRPTIDRMTRDGIRLL
jgi:predicted nucleotidyltransferase